MFAKVGSGYLHINHSFPKSTTICRESHIKTQRDIANYWTQSNSVVSPWSFSIG